MKLTEGLKAGDLEGLVSKRFEVDKYKSKMGEDKDVLVLAFVVDSLAPAKDLERFAEKGYKKVLDADATPGSMKDGKHRVFVEFARTEDCDNHIGDFLEDLGKLCNIPIWEFTYHKKPQVYEASRSNLNSILPRNPEMYMQKISQLKLGEVKDFFDKFNLMEFKMDNNLINITKGKQNLKFELKAWGDTESVLKEVKAFKIDSDSMSECVYLTKFFGPYNITKTSNDSFIFSKNNKSCEVSKHQW
jgi:hypothetical protein|tara:strand:+ start:450 stop:1184 length:735 start_codon:yes stop_codon:yes gene_type:complete